MYNVKEKILLFIFIAFCGNVLGKPRQKYNMYLRTTLGVGFASTQKAINDNYTYTIYYSNKLGPAMSIAGGIKLSKLINIEAEAGFTRLKLASLQVHNKQNTYPTEAKLIKSQNSIIFTMLNGGIEIPLTKIWRPKLSAGIGYIHSDIKYGSTQTNSNNALGMQILFYHQFYFTKYFILNLQSRILFARNIKFLKLDDGTSLKSNLLITTLEIGFTLFIGSGKTKRAPIKY